jgi:hypothetical protein
MIIAGVSLQDLEAARDVASQALGNELIFSELRSYSPTRHAARLQVRHIDRVGARRHCHLSIARSSSWVYVMGLTDKPRRSRYACGYCYAYLFTAIYERAPEATIRTAFCTYRNWHHFLAAYPDVLDMNVGSSAYPIRLADACNCETDEVPTDSIQPWLWRLGEAQMPGPKNMETMR